MVEVPSQSSVGLQAEQRVREIAGLLGVADFVYVPVLESKGSSQREISDGMLICGQDGLIIQVKTRSADQDDDADRAQRWIRKNADAARRQADGTRRRLSQAQDVTFTSLRGYTRTLSGIEGWPAVVIIEHPGIPERLVLEQSSDTIWMTLDDWRELHVRVRSTAAVISYVSRALASGLHPALGCEAERYLALASADAAAPGGPASYPMLPATALEGSEAAFAALIDDLIEKVWPQDGPIPWRDPDDYRLIVERLDRIPPAMRARLGAKVAATLQEAVAAGRRRSFSAIDTSQNARLAFVCDVLRDGEREERLLAEVALLANVRQHQALEGGEDPDSVTLAVGILDQDGRGRQYSFVHVATPPPDVPDDLRAQIEHEYGVLSGRSITPPAA